MIFLVDHNLERHALILSGSISNQGWLDLLSIRFVTLEEVALSVESDDRVVWRFAQSNQMILLTANRRMKGKNSLEQVLREENTITSLPVITLKVQEQKNKPFSLFPFPFLLSPFPNLYRSISA
jgi:hypothetical protein